MLLHITDYVKDRPNTPPATSPRDAAIESFFAKLRPSPSSGDLQTEAILQVNFSRCCRLHVSVCGMELSDCLRKSVLFNTKSIPLYLPFLSNALSPVSDPPDALPPRPPSPTLAPPRPTATVPPWTTPLMSSSWRWTSWRARLGSRGRGKEGLLREAGVKLFWHGIVPASGMVVCLPLAW